MGYYDQPPSFSWIKFLILWIPFAIAMFWFVDGMKWKLGYIAAGAVGIWIALAKGTMKLHK